MRSIRKVMSLALTVIIMLSCIVSVYADVSDSEEIEDVEAGYVTIGGDASVCSTYVIGSMIAAVGTSSFSGSANMLAKANGTISIYLKKKQSDGTYAVVSSATKNYYGVYSVSLSKSYDFSSNPGTYKCQVDCRAYGASYHYESVTAVTVPVTR